MEKLPASVLVRDLQVRMGEGSGVPLLLVAAVEDLEEAASTQHHGVLWAWWAKAVDEYRQAPRRETAEAILRGELGRCSSPSPGSDPSPGEGG